MRILDRYLLRQFLQNFFICFFSLTGLYIVMDAFAKLESFMRARGNLLVNMGKYYAYHIDSFFDQTSGILTLIAAMFTIAIFQRDNELIALQAAGIAKWRIIRPVVVVAILFTVLAATNREMVIPKIRDQLQDGKERDMQGEAAKEMFPRIDNKTDIILRGKSTFAKDLRIDKPAFALPPQLDDYGRQLVAASAISQPSNSQHPAGYLLKRREPAESHRFQSVAEFRQPTGDFHLARLSMAGSGRVLCRQRSDVRISGQCRRLAAIRIASGIGRGVKEPQP